MRKQNWAARIASLIVSLFLLVPSTRAAESPRTGAAPLRILWAGSSSLYYHNAPNVFAQWLARNNGRPAVSELVGRSGTGVHVYLRPEFKAEYGLKAGETVLSKIAEGKYDYVVLQVPAEFIAGPEGEEHDRSLDVYCRAIRAAGGEPVIYEMGWGRDEKAELGRQKIFAAAVRNKVSCFAPCSTAWKRVRTERPELELHNPPDRTHPGTLGLYLNLSCFAAAFSGKAPEGLPSELRIWRKLEDAEKQALAEAVKTAEFDVYETALPGWMRRNTLGAKLETVDDQTATYLRKVAWEEYLAAQKRLREALADQGNANKANARPGSCVEAVRAILAAWNDPEIGETIDDLGGRIAVDASEAETLLEALATNPSIEAVTLRAELLVWLARGDETPSWKRRNRTDRPDVMATEEIGRRAAALLDHEDPFVRGLAEWAIAIRLGVECEGRTFKPWPSADDCDWYRRWAAIGPAQWLETDYVRQATALGWHRSTSSLSESAERLAAQAKGLAGHIRAFATPRERETLEQHLTTLAATQTALAEYAETRPDDLTGQRRRWLAMRRAVRDVALGNPRLGSHEILFATRTGPDNGNIANGGVRDVFGPFGDIHVKRGLSPNDPAEPLIKGRLGPGHIRGLDLWWDADRIVFSYLKQPQYDATANAVSENSELGRSQTARLYEMAIDGSQLRQLTDAPYNSDVEPCYLPDGGIVFASDRSNYGSQCAGSLHQDKMILNLFRASRDGSRIWPLSNNKDFDRYPHMMDNGQILFLHWEYQERHLWQTHTLWTCRPDGSMTDAIYKQHIEGGPMSLREARQIPGQSKLVAIACGHHNGEIGAVFLADYTYGINSPEGMRTVTPHVSATEGGYGNVKPVSEGGVLDSGGHYQFPYPLSDKSFLVSYSYKRPEAERARGFGLYYIDVWGNKELIHRDRRLSVAYLTPLERRARPPILKSEVAAPSPKSVSDERFATVYMADVEHGLSGVEPGTVKYLRISQHVPWPCVREEDKACGYNDLHATPSGAWTRVFGAWTWSPARVIGVVPVEEDGSAYFKVPADQPVYFHALDEHHLEVRRMRSNVTFQHGETRGCVGCHESRSVTPPRLNDWSGLAMRRQPSMPEPPPWGNRRLPKFEQDIQPLFEKHCTNCHGQKTPAGGLEFTSRRAGGYLQSYRSLFGKRFGDALPVSNADAWRWQYPDQPIPPVDKKWFQQIERNEVPGQLVMLANRFGGAEVTQPYEFGSARSRLTRVLIDDPLHRDEVQMLRSEWVALATWIDLNAPYFDQFSNKDTTEGGKPAEWVSVEFPDPWRAAPAGEWVWKDSQTVVLNRTD